MAFVVLLFLAPLSKRSLQANYNDSRPWQLGGHRPRAVDAADMDAKAIRRVALITVRRAICERYPPGRERDAHLAWAVRLRSERTFPHIHQENLAHDARCGGSFHLAVTIGSGC